MSPINHETGLVGSNANEVAEGSGLVHSPRPSGGVHSLTLCGPSLEGQKEMDNPQAILGFQGSPGGLGGKGSFGGVLIKSSLYKGDDISPLISPSAEVSASAKTPETSMAARIREIALAASGTFTVDEITKEVMKSSSISPHLATPEDRESRRKQVSNKLGRLKKEGLLMRIQGQKGTYRRAGDTPEQDPTHPLENEADNGRLRILRTIPKPLPMQLPLGLDQYVLIYPGDLIVVAGATNAGKTAFFLNLAHLNWYLFPVKYLTSELSDQRLSIRLHDFCEVHGTSLDDWEQHVDFRSRNSHFAPALNPACLNVVDYLEIYRDFHEAGIPIKEIFRRQQGQPGVTFMGMQMKHGNSHGRGGALTMEKPFLYLTIDHFKERGLNRLVIEKAKDPARDDVDPNGMDFWFRIERGCRFIPVEKPRDADKLVAQARKQAAGGN
jgi:hypothetical protein